MERSARVSGGSGMARFTPWNSEAYIPRGEGGP